MSAPQPQGKPAVGHGRPPQHKVVPSEWKIELPKAGCVDDRMFGGCRSIEVGYKKEGMVGEGTYGEVFKAYDRTRGDLVALKKIRMDNEKEGFPITAIREIKILSNLATATETLEGHLLRNNIITLREIVRSQSHKSNNEKGSIYMVFDYMEHDMTGLLQRQHLLGRKFEEAQIKCIVKQLFRGLSLLQHKQILHRDLKNSNLLLNNKGELKIADFGLARYMQKAGQQSEGRPDSKMTNRVITVWYRPPELFLGSDHYGPEVDMWSAGCIMFELLTGKPLFPGKDEPGTLEEIFKVMGRPTEDNMPGCTRLPHYHTLNVNNPRYPSRSQLRTHLTHKGLKTMAIDLLEKLLVLDPQKRIYAHDATIHRWFFEAPMPCKPDELPKFEESHEMNMKKRRHEQQQQQQQQHGRQQRQRTDGQYGGPQHGGGQQRGYGGPPGQQQVYPPHAGPHRGQPPPQQQQRMPPGQMGPPSRGGAPAAGAPGGGAGRPFLAAPVGGVPGMLPGGRAPLVAPVGAFAGMPLPGMPHAPHPQQQRPPYPGPSGLYPLGGAPLPGQGGYPRGGPPAGPAQQGAGQGPYPGGGSRPGSGAPHGGAVPDWVSNRR